MYNADELRLFYSKVKSGVCSHAYIVDGADGVGKLSFALECARAMLCTGKNSPCGLCDSCLKAESGGHPDIHVIGRDKTAAIADVRELVRKSSLKPNDSEKQIFIVANANKLREDSQNALLKLFEEPPETVAIFLLTDSRASLLPTVLSRGQRIHLDGMRDSELESALKERHPDLRPREIRDAVEIALGNLGIAEAHLSKDALATRKKAENLLTMVINKQNFEVTAALLTPKFKREQIMSLLTELIALTLEAEKYKQGVSGARLPEGDARDAIERSNKKALSMMTDAATNCLRNLDLNANITAALSKLAIELLIAATK